MSRRAVAVDGPAASGKGTLARRIAAELGVAHLDTGLLYRAVGWAVRDRPDDLDAATAAARALTSADLERPELRGQAAGAAASKVAAIPAVRAALLDFQRAFAARPEGAVLDGRDIGTVICPDAAAKLYIDAAVEVRARRRFDELQARGEAATYAAVLEDLIERDRRDSTRAAAPLASAVDAFVIDTSEMAIEQVVALALDHVRRRLTA